MKNNYIKKLKWNDFFNQVQIYGKNFIDEKKANELVIQFKDVHTIPFRITKDFPDWIIKNIPVKIELIQLFAISPNSLGMLHKDGINRLCAVNIPVSNCNKGVMHWYDTEYEEILYNNQYTKVRLTRDEDINRPFKISDNPSYKTVVNVPSVVNTNVWHRIDNRKNSNYRWMLSFRFKENPTYNDICDYFK